MTELTFKGKEFVYNHHLSVPFRPLVPHADKGIGEVDLDGNLIIQGDNLHALKALLPRYAGKVDCIFIDPPYNRGSKDWAYRDDVNAPMIKEWFAKTFDDFVDKADGLRHDKWCAMIWPRLRLLYDLLAENGSIWISLDDNEAHRAKLLMDDIFGEKNFIANVIWEKKYTRSNDATYFSDNHDHILCYAKNKRISDDPLSLAKNCFKIRGLERTDEQKDAYQNPDGHKKGAWKPTPLHAKSGTNTEEYIFPNGVKWSPPIGTFHRLSDDTKAKLYDADELWFGVDGRQVPQVKSFLDEVKDDVTPITIWDYENVGHNHEANSELKEIGLGGQFQTPKPTRLIDQIISLACDSEATILDSFSGSGTTAHSVLKANKRDGGNRKFILVEMEDYADRLTAERVRRVINGYEFSGTQKTELMRESLNWRVLQKADDLVQRVNAIENLHGHEYDKISKQVKDGELIVTGEKAVAERTEGLGGTFTYCTLGEPVELDAILTGNRLPSYEALGGVLYHMATNRTLESAAIRQEDFHLGEQGGRHVWLIYKPDLEWLKGPQAALTLNFARKLAKDYPDKDHLVFAASRFVSEKLLKEEGLRVEFVPLPFALYRIEQS